MTRKYARLMVSVWDDKEYQALSLANQGMFCNLLAYPQISYAGVIDFIPKRLTRVSDELTERTLKDRLNELNEARFIVADSDTDELLIRRFVYYDDIMKVPNVAKAMGKAVDQMQSALLRDVVIWELGRIYVENPNLHGWEGSGPDPGGLMQAFPDLYDEVQSAADLILYPNGKPNPSSNPSANPSGMSMADLWGTGPK